MTVRLILAACMDLGSNPSISTKRYLRHGDVMELTARKGYRKVTLTGESVEMAMAAQIGIHAKRYKRSQVVKTSEDGR